ncbi:MAG: RluA family pseudouridine synthase, partial [Acidobacteriota bacterium]
MDKIHLVTGEVDTGTRLDVFIAQSIETASRSAVQRWIAAERVSVDGVPRKASFVLAPGQAVTVHPLPPEPTELIPEPISLSILFEDEDLIVIDKPAGLVVHPGAGNWSGTMANALAFHFEQISRQETIRPGIVHRLDKGTSGVILVAKNESAHDFLAAQFERREVQKTYLALLYGRLQPPKGEIDLPIGRDPKVRTKISPRSSH